LDLALPSPAASAQPKAPNPSRTHPHRGSPLFRLRRQGADLVDGSSLNPFVQCRSILHEEVLCPFLMDVRCLCWRGPMRTATAIAASWTLARGSTTICMAAFISPAPHSEGGDGCVHIVPAVINCATYIKTLASYFRI